MKYESIIFDFDGVIIESNNIKTMHSLISF